MQVKKGYLKVHPFFKLGKAPAKRDKRNIMLAAVLKKLPAVPKTWDFDRDYAQSPIPTPMFLNDKLGDCVMAGRAHMTLRFEYFEQGCKVLNITDAQVLAEYKREGGSTVEGQQGLIMLDSLKSWRTDGWKAAGNKYHIFAFTEVDRSNINEVQVAVRYLTGAYVGLALPNCWQDQIQRGQPWDIIPGPDGKPNPNNGHCVYICGYTEKGPVCVTWGQKQAMTWKFFTTCADEAYAIVDARDPFVEKSPVDVAKLSDILKAL